MICSKCGREFDIKGNCPVSTLCGEGGCSYEDVGEACARCEAAEQDCPKHIKEQELIQEGGK